MRTLFKIVGGCLKRVDIFLAMDYYGRCPVCWKADKIGYPRIDGAVCWDHINASKKEIRQCYEVFNDPNAV